MLSMQFLLMFRWIVNRWSNIICMQSNAAKLFRNRSDYLELPILNWLQIWRTNEIKKIMLKIDRKILTHIYLFNQTHLVAIFIHRISSHLILLLCLIHFSISKCGLQTILILLKSVLCKSWRVRVIENAGNECIQKKGLKLNPHAIVRHAYDLERKRDRVCVCVYVHENEKEESKKCVVHSRKHSCLCGSEK